MGKLFGDLNCRKLGSLQGEGWYFVGQNSRSHFRSPSPRSKFCLGSIPESKPFRLLAHLGASEYAKDFGQCSS